MINQKYSLQNLKRVIQDPHLFKNEVDYQNLRLKKTIHRHFIKILFERKHGKGLDVMREDWDNLLILDACRYDIFKEINNIPGNLSSVISKGSTSKEFMRANFRSRELHDTIYVSGNGNSEELDDDDFFTMIKTYDRHEDRYRGWMPDHIREIAVETYRKYPDKRLIVHFMQPHTPYIGPKADQLRKHLHEEHGLQFKEWSMMRGGASSECEPKYSSLRYAAVDGYISDEELREIYIENLNLVFDEVRTFLDKVDGKTVITSDHGELLGDASGPLVPKQYGHPGYTYLSELRYVPWLETETGSRREVVSEEPIGTDEVDKEAVQANLEALGYM